MDVGAEGAGGSRVLVWEGSGRALFSCVNTPVFKLIFDDFVYPCYI